MEDLSEKLTRLLSSPEGMEKIQSAMTALGGMMGEETPTPTPAPAPSPPMDNSVDIAAISKLLPLLGNLNQENEDTRLLSALRPYLHGQRAQRLEESMRLLRLMKLLPLITEGGVKDGG